MHFVKHILREQIAAKLSQAARSFAFCHGSPWRGAKHRKHASNFPSFVAEIMRQLRNTENMLENHRHTHKFHQIPSSRTSSTGTQSALQWQFIHIS